MTDETAKIKLEDFGYDDFFDSQWKLMDSANSSLARVISEHRESYKVKNTDGEYLAKITGKQMFNAVTREDFPAVGDWVAITNIDEERAVIQSVLPRKTMLRKKYSSKQDTQIIATNVDVAFIVESLERDFNLNRFERYLVLANEGRIKPVIILNKIDLVSDEQLNLILEQTKKRFEDIDIILTSAVTDQGLGKLIEYIIKGKTYCFLGSSGVGKSSLINGLLQTNEIKTSPISDYTGRGMHSTTTREMYFLKSGGIVIDNPGTREVGMAEVTEGIENIFDEITALATGCKFADCTHTHEPKCAVRKAVEENELDMEKYQNFLKLKSENEFNDMTGQEKRKKDRKFGQSIKKKHEEVKKYKPRY
ncbi:MAG: ribosome small subunit-dependent GTPase A [Sedimentisphaerales bacterium]|nr:ribosome small subunit-dependent GTPase A [Sedimentisphaerales bacterium]